MKLGLFTILAIGALSITCTQAQNADPDLSTILPNFASKQLNNIEVEMEMDTETETPIRDRNLQDNRDAAESGTRYGKSCTIPCMYKILKARKCQYKYCCGTHFRHSYASEVGEDVDSSENSMMDMSMDMDMMDMGMDMGMGMEDIGMSEMADEEEGTSIGGQWRKKYCPYRCMYYVYEAWKCQKYHKCCRTRPFGGDSSSD